MSYAKSPSASTRQFLFFLGVIITLLCILVFGNVVTHRFITLDDLQLIFFNPAAKGPTLANLKTAFTTFDPELYIPLTLVSYQLEYFAAGTNAALTHTVNLGLHIANAILVSWLVLVLTKKKWVAAVTALLFAIHPLHTEAVAWAAARKDVLSSLFFLSSTIAFFLSTEKYGEKKFPIVSIILFFLGLLSKALVLPLPIILFVILWVKGERIHRSTFITLAPFFLLSILFGIIGLFGKQEIVGSLTPIATLLMAAKSTTFYVKSLFLPVPLVVMYPQVTPITIQSLEFAIPVLVVLSIVIGSIALLKKTRIIFGAMLFFFLLLAPTFINFSKAGDVYFASDRYAYLPSIAIFFLLALGLDSLVLRINSRARQRHIRSIIHAATGTLVIILCFLSFEQTKTWQDSIALFEHSVANFPESSAAHLNLGVLYLETGYTDKAIASFKRSADIRMQTHALSGLASAYHAQGKNTEAIAEYKKAIALDPKDAEPYFGLANLLAESGEEEKAESEYEKAIMIDPNYVAAYNNFGVLLMSTGNLERAETMFLKARDLNAAFSKTHFNLGKLYQTQRRNDEAMLSFQRVLALDSDSTEAMINLAATYVVAKNPTEALFLLKKALAIEPENIDAKALIKEMIRLNMIGEQKR